MRNISESNVVGAVTNGSINAIYFFLFKWTREISALRKLHYYSCENKSGNRSPREGRPNINSSSLSDNYNRRRYKYVRAYRFCEQK